MDKQKIYEFLKSHPVGVLATVDSNNNPNATAIYVLAEDDLSIKFISKRDTQKAKNIKSNNQVVLVVFEAATETNLQVIGTVEDISNQEQSNEVFTKVLEITKQTSQGEVPPISKLFAGHYVVYRIIPKQIRYSNYQLHPDSDSETEFITLDF